MYMGQSRYTGVRHIPGGDNPWGDFLPWVRSVTKVQYGPDDSVVRMCAITVITPASENFSMPSKGEIRDPQDAVAEGQEKIGMPLGTMGRG